MLIIKVGVKGGSVFFFVRCKKKNEENKRTDLPIYQFKIEKENLMQILMFFN